MQISPGRAYLIQRIKELEHTLKDKTQNVQRLSAIRDDMNFQVRSLRDEIISLHKPACYVGEFIKFIAKEKAIVKMSHEGKYVVSVGKDVNKEDLKANARIVLTKDTHEIVRVLPTNVDPLVSLMKVEKAPDSTYDQIGGLKKQIEEVKDVIELPIKHPELYEATGISQPKGVLLYGPPGTGKTLLARAVAHHTDCTFIRVSGGELVQKYIGEGAKMVRELFVMAKKHAPTIIFIDEIDSIGGKRLGGGSKGGDSEVQRTMLELLNQLDGFDKTPNVKIVMATNRIDILDPALLRPGRIDRKIEFPHPNVDARVDILKIHSRKMNLKKGINLKKIAEKMHGANGAETKAVCSEAGMYALRERRSYITQEDFDLAVTKVMKKNDDKDLAFKKLWN